MTGDRKYVQLAALGVILTLFLQINSATAVGPESYWPTNDWQVATPEEQGLNSTLLNQVDSLCNDTGDYCFLVTRNGYLVHETYFSPYHDETNILSIGSTATLVNSLLIGIAIEKGFIDNVSQKVLDFFPDREVDNLDSRKESITIEYLLTMTSGMQWDEGNFSEWNDYYEMRETLDWIQYVLDKPMEADPGTVWNFNRGGSHLLSAIINITTGQTPLMFAEENLFDPLGIESYGWIADDFGINVGGSSISLTSRGLTKIGLLCLNDGVWEEEQLIPSLWIENMTQVHSHANDENRYGWYWTEFGYHCWVNSTAGFYGAHGREGQHVYVIPEHDIVVVFTGHVTDGYTLFYDDLVLEYVIGAILPVHVNLIPIAAGVGVSIGVIAIVGFVLRRR